MPPALAGKIGRGPATTVDGVRHRSGDRHQPSIRLPPLAEYALVSPHEIGDGRALPLAEKVQLVGAVEWKRPRNGCGCVLQLAIVLSDHLAHADHVIGALEKDSALALESGETNRVGGRRRRTIVHEAQVRR